jgi:ankyrin repeat protein
MRLLFFLALLLCLLSPLQALADDIDDLCLAAEKGNVIAIKALLNAHPSLVNARDRKYGGTALHRAAGIGEKRAVEVLLAFGADPNAADRDGLTSLHCAAAFNRSSIVSMLIDRGAHTYASDGNGQTPLHLAVARGHKKTIKVLVKRGADITTADKKGESPLSMATRLGKKDIIRLLTTTPAGGLKKKEAKP